MTWNVYDVFKRMGASITYVKIIVYLSVLFLIVRSIIKAMYNFIVDRDNNKWYDDTKLDFIHTISISLTAILFLEILKLFYIKTAYQIFVLASIIALKLVINYFVESDLKELKKEH